MRRMYRVLNLRFFQLTNIQKEAGLALSVLGPDDDNNVDDLTFSGSSELVVTVVIATGPHTFNLLRCQDVPGLTASRRSCCTSSCWSVIRFISVCVTYDTRTDSPCDRLFVSTTAYHGRNKMTRLFFFVLF